MITEVITTGAQLAGLPPTCPLGQSGDLISLVKEISDQALNRLLHDAPSSLIECQELYILYSMRRALPAITPPIKPIREWMPGLFAERGPNKFHVWYNRCYDSLNGIRFTDSSRPTFVSNKSTIEFPRSKGGRDLFSSQLLKISPRAYTRSDDCENIDHNKFLYEQILAFNDAKRSDSSYLLSCAITIAREVKKHRQPLWAMTVIPERGAKFRLPNIPEWHNQILGEQIGYVGTRLLRAICPNTYEERNYTFPNDLASKHRFYSGDFLASTDFLFTEAGRAAGHAMIHRVGTDNDQLYTEIIDLLYQDHIILDPAATESYRSRFVDIFEPDLPEYSDTEIVILKTVQPTGTEYPRPSFEKIEYEPVDDPWDCVIVHDVAPPALDPALISNPYWKNANIWLDEDAPIDFARSIYGQAQLSWIPNIREEEEAPRPVKAHIPPPDHKPVKRVPIYRDTSAYLKLYSHLSYDDLLQGYSVERFRGGGALFKGLLKRNLDKGGIPSYIDIVPFKSRSMQEDGIFGYAPKRILRHRMVSLHLTRLLDNVPAGERTCRGLGMCYNGTFAILSFLNWSAHRAIGLSLRNFFVTGDDNNSAHVEPDKTIPQLEAMHQDVGFIPNVQKIKISDTGYLHAENVFIVRDGGFLSVETLHLKALFPQKVGNSWLTMPRSILPHLRGTLPELVHRIYTYIFQRHERKYSRLLLSGLDIFNQPLGAPLFPVKVASQYDTKFDLFDPDALSVVLSPRLRGQHSLSGLSTFVNLIRDETPSTTFAPGDPFSQAQPKAIRRDLLMKALVSYTTPNQLRNPFPSQVPDVIKLDDIIRDLESIPRVTSFRTISVVTTSILGLLRGLKWIPDQYRSTPRDIVGPVLLKVGTDLTEVEFGEVYTFATVITIVPRRNISRRDVGYWSNGVLYLLWESRHRTVQEGLESTKQWLSSNNIEFHVPQ